MTKRKTSSTPIFDITNATRTAAHSAGHIEGRNSMKIDALALARSIKNPGAQVLRLIEALEQLDIRKAN